MILELEEIRWDGLFPPSADGVELKHFTGLHAGKSILGTGAGGSIGSALVRAVAKLAPSQLVLVDSSEQNLFSIHKYLSSQSTDHIPVLASVVDELCIRDLFVRFRPQIVYHCAALKHVTLGEKNSFAVVENNIFGTLMVAELTHEFGAERLVMVFTDKSVSPESIMGASQRVAEVVLQPRASAQGRMTSIRLGNVLGSEGSVVQLFLQQIAQGGPAAVTDSQVERYFLTMDSTVLRVLASAADCPAHPAIAIPVLNKPVKITDLARYVIDQASAKDIQITYIGLRPRDKLHEEFVAPGEAVSHETANLLQGVRGQDASASQIAQGAAELRKAVENRDLARLLSVLVDLVPEYRPSGYLRKQLGAAVS